MAWTEKTLNSGFHATEDYDLPDSGEAFSSVIKNIKPNGNQNRYVTITAKATAVSGTNIDLKLYGSFTEAGTVKFLLLDAPVADLTDATLGSGQVDFNAYPAPYYFISWTVDADESANDITIQLFAAKAYE